MKTAKRIIVAGLLALSLLAIPAGVSLTTNSISLDSGSVAHAVQNNGGGGDQTVSKKDLEDRGYTCKNFGAGGWECTKPGEPKYYCDRSGMCGKVIRPGAGMNPGTHTAPGGGTATTKP